MDWHQVSRGPVSILAEARTTHKRRWSTTIAITRAVGMCTASKIILFRDFQMDHRRARIVVFRAFLCICGRSSERPSRRVGKSLASFRLPEGETMFHTGRRRGQQTNRCAVFSVCPGQNGQSGESTQPRRCSIARVLVFWSRRIQKNTRTLSGAKQSQLVSWPGTTHPEECKAR
jgi:hypothetical protein